MQSPEERVRDLVQGIIPRTMPDDARSAVEHRVQRRRHVRRLGTVAVGVGLSVLAVGVAFWALRPVVPSEVPATGPTGFVHVLTSSQAGPKIYSVDVATGRSTLVRTLVAEGNFTVVGPDIATSPDGSRLFVAWEDAQGQRIDMMDSGTGAVISSSPISGLPPTQLPMDFMSVDSTGNAFIYQVNVALDGSVTESVSTYDAASGLLPGKVSMTDCGGENWITAVGPRTFAVACTISRVVKVVTVGPSGTPVAEFETPLPLKRPPDDSTVLPDHAVSDVVFYAPTASLYIITESGRTIVVDSKTSKLKPEMQLDMASANTYIAFGGAAMSRDNSTLYVETGSRASYDPRHASGMLAFSARGGALVADEKVSDARPELASSGSAVVLLETAGADSLVALDRASGRIATTDIPAGETVTDVS